MKSIRPAKILDYAANNGFSVEDIDSYSGQHKPLTFRCLKCNNTFKRTWNNLRANTNCPSCNPKKWSIERIQTEIENRGTGWELLSTEYKNNKEPLIFRCPSGHILRKPMQQWLLWDCPICSGLSSKTEQEVRTCVEKEGYELLDAQLRAGSKILSTSILTILCDRGHIYKTRWSYFKSGSRCNNGCAKWKPMTLEEVAKKSKEYRIEVLSTEYKNQDENLSFQCIKNSKHIFEKSWKLFSQNPACPRCQASAPENEISNSLESKNLEVQRSNRKILAGWEIDVFVPKHSIGVEYNGIYYHSNIFYGAEYHREKYYRAADKGIQLVTVWGDDWQYRRESIEHYFQQLFSKEYATHCSAEINKDRAVFLVFCEDRKIGEVVIDDDNISSIDIPHTPQVSQIVFDKIKSKIKKTLVFRQDLSYPRTKILDACDFKLKMKEKPKRWIVEGSKRVEKSWTSLTELYDCGYELYSFS